MLMSLAGIDLAERRK